LELTPCTLINYKNNIADAAESQVAQDQEHRVSTMHCPHRALTAAAQEHPGDLPSLATATGSAAGQRAPCCHTKLLAKSQTALVGISAAPALQRVGCSGFCLGPDLTDSTSVHCRGGESPKLGGVKEGGSQPQHMVWAEL